MNATNIQYSTSGFKLIHITRIASSVGVILNLLGLKIMLNPRLIHRLYNFIWSRTFCNLLVCFLGSILVDPIEFYKPKTYYQNFFGLYFVIIVGRMVMTSSSISDVILILNRFYVIDDKPARLSEISKLTNLSICLGFSVILYLPMYFACELVPIGSDDLFVFKLNYFGQSNIFKVFVVLTFFGQIFLGVFVLGVLQVISVIKFREIMIRKGHLLQNRTETKRAERMYTKMVFILTTICLITRSIEAINSVSLNIVTLKIYEITDSTTSYLMLLNDITLLLLFSAHAFDILVYLIMDPNLRMCTREFFCGPIPEDTTVSILKFNIKLIKIRLLTKCLLI